MREFLDVVSLVSEIVILPENHDSRFRLRETGQQFAKDYLTNRGMKEPWQTHTQGFCRERKKNVNRDSEANETLSEN